MTKEIFKRKPAKPHVVDISENNMVELVRDIRSSFGYIEGELATGTAGFIGFYLAKRLLESGDTKAILDDHPKKVFNNGNMVCDFT